MQILQVASLEHCKSDPGLFGETGTVIQVVDNTTRDRWKAKPVGIFSPSFFFLQERASARVDVGEEGEEEEEEDDSAAQDAKELLEVLKTDREENNGEYCEW